MLEQQQHALLGDLDAPGRTYLASGARVCVIHMADNISSRMIFNHHVGLPMRKKFVRVSSQRYVSAPIFGLILSRLGCACEDQIKGSNIHQDTVSIAIAIHLFFKIDIQVKYQQTSYYSLLSQKM